MVLAWLLFPAVILLGTVALGLVGLRLADEQRALRAEVDELADLGPVTGDRRNAGRSRRATGPQRVHR